jgi:hypothetical protein
MPMEIESNIFPSVKSSHVVIGAQSNDHSAFLAGVSAKQFFTDAATFARVQLLATEYYRLDVLSNFWISISKFRKEKDLLNLCEIKGNPSTFNGNTPDKA